MTYATPSASDLQKRFPRFASVDAEIVADAIAEAENKVDDTWREEDRKLGTMLYAAHVLTLDGHGSGAEAEGFLQGTAGLKSVSSGSLSLTRFDRGLADSGSGLNSTSFGQRFRELLGLNVGAGVRVGGQ